MHIIVFGSINIDLAGRLPHLPRAGETLHGDTCAMSLGGKGANQAVAAARLGARVDLVARLGADAFGAMATERLAAFGVGTSAVTSDRGAMTGIAMIHVDAEGRNTITVFAGANTQLGAADLARAEAAMQGASALLLQLEVPQQASLAAAQRARAAGATVILDPAPCPPQGVPDLLLAAADVVTPNEVEAEILTGIACDTTDGARRAARQLVERGARVAVVKLGGRGAYLFGGGQDMLVAPFVVPTVDTVAAGDCFNAGLAVALSEGLDLPDAVRLACACGALATTRPGAADAAPSRDEVNALLARSPVANAC